jgi:hypothetical protein
MGYSTGRIDQIAVRQSHDHECRTVQRCQQAGGGWNEDDKK